MEKEEKMSEQRDFKKPTKLQILGTIIILSIACLIEGASDWLDSLNTPSLTGFKIAIDAIWLFFIGLVIGVPVAMLVWNRLVAPIFELPKVQYIHALVLVTVIYWFNGL